MFRSAASRCKHVRVGGDLLRPELGERHAGLRHIGPVVGLDAKPRVGQLEGELRLLHLPLPGPGAVRAATRSQ